MAMDTLWITTVRVLAAFNVDQAIGEDGNAIPFPRELFSSGFVT